MLAVVVDADFGGCSGHGNGYLYRWSIVKTIVMTGIAERAMLPYPDYGARQAHRRAGLSVVLARLARAQPRREFGQRPVVVSGMESTALSSTGRSPIVGGKSKEPGH